MIHFEDTDSIIYLDKESGSLYTSSNSGEDFTAVDTDGVKFKYLLQHPFKDGYAYAISQDLSHYRTTSRGNSWKKFTTDVKPATDSVETLNSFHSPIVFHGSRPEYALFAGPCKNGQDSETCERQYYYTRDNFEEVRPLTTAYSCLFNEATPNIASKDPNAVTCIVDGEQFSTVLATSDDWFNSKKFVVVEAGILSNIKKLGAGSHSLITLSSQLGDTSKLDVFSSFNGYDWQRVEFPENTELSTEFTVVEGTKDSLFIDVKYAGSEQVGQLFFSAGVNGSYFVKSLDYTNRDANDNVDYELVSNVDGVVLANTVSNGAAVVKGNEKSKIESKISFDQGLTWNGLQAEGEALHLHSLVQRYQNNPSSPGKYFSSPVPGILLGVGNTGSSLTSYDEGDTYISLDSGLTWSKTLNGAHLFEFGDQGSIILAVEDGADTSTVKFTTNQGKSWQQIALDQIINAKLLTTTPDSTNFKFLISGKTSNGDYKTYYLNFQGLYDSKCSDSDYEKWSVKGPGSSDSMCVSGYKQQFQRRIRDANCFVGKEFEEFKAVKESCPCTKNDFVCDYDFKKDSNGECVSILSDEKFEAKYCSNNAESYSAPSGYTLQPGNQCSLSSGVDLSKAVEKNCGSFTAVQTAARDENNYQAQESDNKGSNIIDYDENDVPDETGRDDGNPDEREGEKKKAQDGKNDGRVKTQAFGFAGKIVKYEYLDRVPGSNLKDETIVLLTSLHRAYVTHDQGSTWEQIAPEEEILDIFVNPHNTNHVYLLSTNQKIIYSTDRADNWKSFRTPANFIPGVNPLRFHARHSDWFIYIGQLDCDTTHTGACRTVTYRTQSYGKRFQLLQEHVKSCDYIGHLAEPTEEKLIVCQREENEHTIHSEELIFTEDYFQTTQTPLTNVIGFVQADDFLVAATASADGALKAHVSVDGKNWADAEFPSNFRVDKKQAYTVLSAQSHAIFLHVTTNARTGTEFGAILKSNSNGTSYVMSEQNVNRDAAGYVDFEQMENLEGVAIINTVRNAKEAKGGARKQLSSKITHNDGSDWDFLQPPSVDSTGAKYECIGKAIKDCSLHLHGYTERADYRDTFSSGSAIGMMIGVGNVGDQLGSYLDGNTFLTRDGGVTWKEVKKGVYQWEYGDQGSILVLVNGQDSTNTISYSLDEGETWQDYQFADDLVVVNDISTVPSDDSRKFLLFTKLPAAKGDRATVYQIDFSQLLKRKCSLDLLHPDTDDFDLWTPKHPHQSDNCLFGHEAKYYRKVPGKDCYIGEKLTKPYEEMRNCACTRQDFECDFNYFRDQNGECKLVPGYTPPDHSLVCKEFGVDEYWLPTGYRRIPLSTCVGGHEFDKVEAQPCPGKEEEFKRNHKGLTGFPLFLVIIIPILGASILIFVIYNHYVGRYGQIKLGDDDQAVEFDNSSQLNRISSIIGYGVVTTVSFLSRASGNVVDFVKSKIIKQSVSLDGYSAAATTAYSDDILDETSLHTTANDDILDDGDLTEAEDDRL